MLCALMICSPVKAQLKADFTIDKAGGCSPLTVSFTNKSSGHSSNAIFKWDLGNGNTSSIANPGAIYNDEKIYTVILTVQDGNQSSTATKYVTVYSKPVVDFSNAITKGCLPLAVNFTSTATAGSGNISSYYWDFGDGSTQQGSSNLQPHTYQHQQKATVSLTVTNSFGCYSTVQKKDVVEVIPALLANFNADQRILCRITDAVQFTNTSSGPGTLTYEWDFGDGTKSTAPNPSHVFNKRGIFTVKLTVFSSEGCMVTSTQNGMINVAEFNTDFTSPGTACTEKQYMFNSVSSPAPDNTLWEVDGVAYNWYSNYFQYAFNTAGTYKVKLTNTYGTCIDSAVKMITVKPTPTSIGFVHTLKGFCGAPVAVDFKDTTADATSWRWNMDWSGSGNGNYTQQSFTHTFNENRLYHVQLQVTNSAGCTKEIYKTVNLPYPYVQIFYTQSSGNPPTRSCGPLTMKWSSTATEPITQYRWEFGDGGTSTDAEPSHTFSKTGNFQVKLHYTTSNGCTGTAFYNSVIISEKPKADFRSLNGTLICGNTPVTFSNLTPGSLTGMNWYVNDVYVGQGTFSTMTYRFQEAGKNSIKLIAFNDLCSDTIIKTDYIEVVPPFPDINTAVNTCDGTRGLVTFTQSSRGAQSWTWNFGDGNTATLNTDQPTISHTYNATGYYLAILSVTNGACTVRDSVPVYVMLKKNITLSAPATICAATNLTYTLSNLQDNPYPHYWNHNYYFARWEYEDGTAFTGYNQSYVIDRSPTYSGTLSQPDESKQQLRLIVNSEYFNCTDTSNFTPIKIVGSQAAFDISDVSTCFNTPVTFTDKSTTNGTTIKRWDYYFGNGQSVSRTNNDPVTHNYAQPGTYYVHMVTTDDKGCTSSTPTYTQVVSITGPLASFTPSGTNVPLNTTITFYNTTQSHGAYNTVYQWDFGDGTNANEYSPSHTYPVAGTYTIKLTASDHVTGCRSEVSTQIVVRNFNTAFNFSKSYITAQSCPPVLVRFNNTSVGFTRVTWDFGDGITVDNVNYPTHIYEKPGKYIITLYIYGPNGLKGTYLDSVVIQQPKASMAANDKEGCIGHMVTLNAIADSTKSYTWDFGDGTVVTNSDSFYTHRYRTPGLYAPAVLLRDENGCTGSASLNDKIIVRPDPVVNITPAQPVVCLGSSTVLQASGGVTYAWSPAMGLNNSTVASPVASPVTATTYTVRVLDDIGCEGTGSVSVAVVEPVTVAVPADMSVCLGNSVTIPATGAVIYNWINNTTGLNDTRIANPSAMPAITTTYTVVGSDAHQCFTDTAEVTLRVLPLPAVNAGVDVEVQAGTPVELFPTYSNDVIQWTWTPATYLSCSNCPAPVAKPLAQTEYVLTVKNNVGCFAKDSMLVKMICDEARVAIPNAFTPNGDGHNDEFIIRGISIIRHMVIYNRWGQKVFERNNFIAADRSVAWKGVLNGYPASEGTYVYYVEMECPTGGVFTRKGSFVLVR